MNWEELAVKSPYQTAVAIKAQLDTDHLDEAKTGLEELIEAMSRSEQRALKSQLVRLMTHIIKWQLQPERRTRSWVATIYNARDEIKEIQEETPRLTDTVILEIWPKCLKAAIREAEGEMSRDITITQLSWQEVFEDEYRLS